MQKFLSRLAIFSAPFLVAWLLLLFIPLDREFAYAYAQKDSDPFPYVFHRIHTNPTPIDWAFLGSSRTMAAINERRVEERLDTLYGQQLHLANLGINRNGRNLHWVLAGHLFERKKPEVLVVEVQAEEGKYSHLDFPYLASAKQLFGSELIINKAYFGDIASATEVRFLYYRDDLLGDIRDSIPSPDLRNHSYLEYDTITVADSALLADFEARRMKKARRGMPESTTEKLDFWWRFTYPKAYVERISELCRENEVRLVFLYVPGYGMPLDRPVDFEWYQTQGEVWLPPDSLYRNPRNWHDPNHLSGYGSQVLSAWLADKIGAEN